jgi:predicted nucleic-acid-binding protein
MRAIDTNVLVRLITRDDPAKVVAAEAFIARGVWASHVVIAETIWVLRSSYGLGHDSIVSAIEMLLGEKRLTMQEPEVIEAALEQYRLKPSIGFSDCLIREIARHTGHVPLGTFDRALGRLPDAELL